MTKHKMTVKDKILDYLLKTGKPLHSYEIADVFPEHKSPVIYTALKSLINEGLVKKTRSEYSAYDDSIDKIFIDRLLSLSDEFRLIKSGDLIYNHEVTVNEENKLKNLINEIDKIAQ